MTRFPIGTTDFSLLQITHTGSVAHPATHPMGTGSSFPENKAAGEFSWQVLTTWCRG